jgi:hypothetical protein
VTVLPDTGVVPPPITDAVDEAFSMLAIVEEAADRCREEEVKVLDIVGARGVERVDRSSRLDGWVETGGSSVSQSIRLPLVPRLRVSLSPPTDTNVALVLSGMSLPGLSPFEMLGFFRGLITVSIGDVSSLALASARLSSSALAFNRLFL